jgi:hypothetical protein
MKRIRGFIAVAAVVALTVVGCGGGNGGGGTGPTASSAKTARFMLGSFNFVAGSFALIAVNKINPSISAGISKQTGDPVLDCTWTNDDFVCTIYDDQSHVGENTHRCDVSGILVTNGGADFDADYVCTGFKPDDDTTVDGNFSAVVQTGGAIDISASASEVFKGVVAKQTNTTCPVNDNDTSFESPEDGNCDWVLDGTNVCDDLDAIIKVVVTVDQGGVEVVDECGTYQLGLNAVSTSVQCLNADAKTTINYDGSYNGSSVDANYNITCDLT